MVLVFIAGKTGATDAGAVGSILNCLLAFHLPDSRFQICKSIQADGIRGDEIFGKCFFLRYKSVGVKLRSDASTRLQGDGWP